MDWTYIAGWLVTSLLMLAGFAGNLLPMVPAAPLLMGSFLLGAWLDGFQRVGWPTLAVLLVLAAIMGVVDFVAGAWGAKKVGASRQAVVGATVGSLVGMFAGIVGLIIGPFVGALLGELLVRRDLPRAGKVGAATWLGMLLGGVLKVALSLLMIGLFWAVYLWSR